MGIGKREFDRAYGDHARRLAALEKWREDHETDHDEDDDERRDGRRWTFTQIVAVLAAAATLGGFYLEARGGR